jgi:hypothetical protein
VRGILDHLRRIGRIFRSIRTALKTSAVNDNACRCKGRFVGLASPATRGRPKIRNGKSQRVNLTRKTRSAIREDVKEHDTLKGGKFSDDSSDSEEDIPDS